MKSLLLFVLLIPTIIQAEPFPEVLKESSQILVCSSSTEEWIITWGMATEWFPNEKINRIIFNDGNGRETVIPTPNEYKCTVLTSGRKKKEKDET